MLKISDPQLFNLINEEIQRQKNTYSLIASENICSAEVLEALGSPLTNKYSEGYPLKRYYNGNRFIDEIELLTIERAKKLFGCEFANVQAYSGSPANHAVYLGLLEPGDTVLGFDLASGGHLTHGAKVNFSGKYYNSQNYFVDNQTNLLNYDEISDIAHKLKPKLIVAGLTAYPREIDFKKFSDIAKSVGAYLLADISHISGMVAVGLHNSPIGFADVVMTTTHKQLRGPRGALILSNNEELMTKINKAVFPGLQGGPHNNQTAAIAVALNEALDSNYKVYIEKVIQNRKVIEDILRENEIKMITGGSDNHLLLLDVGFARGKSVANNLEEKNIIVNANSIPFDTSKPLNPSGIRIGTPCITTQGIDNEKLIWIANEIVESIKKAD